MRKPEPYTIFKDQRANDRFRSALRELIEKGYVELITSDDGKEMMRLTEKARKWKKGSEL